MTTGASPAAVSGPSISTVTSAANTVAANNEIANQQAEQAPPETTVTNEDSLSIITVDVIGYGDPSEDEFRRLFPAADYDDPRVNYVDFFGNHGDIGGEVVIVASKGGADEHPAWYLNIRDSATIKVQIGPQAFRMA